jgi:hypothetical protein
MEELTIQSKEHHEFAFNIGFEQFQRVAKVAIKVFGRGCYSIDVMTA